MTRGTLLEASKGAVESTFPDVTGVELAAQYGAQVSFLTWSAQIAGLSLLDDALMRSQGSATIGGGTGILFGFESSGMCRSALSGISVVVLGEWTAVSGRRPAVCVYFRAVRMSLRETGWRLGRLHALELTPPPLRLLASIVPRPLLSAVLARGFCLLAFDLTPHMLPLSS